MGKINRFAGNLLAFAINALADERTVFGDTAQSDTLDANLNTDFFRGWGIVGVNDFPTRQDFNALGFSFGQILAYLHQMGIPEWNSNQEYFVGSHVIHAGQLYKSLTINTATNPSTSPSDWLQYEAGETSYPEVTPGGGLTVNVSAGKTRGSAVLGVTSITRSGATATVTTDEDHGLTSGFFVGMSGANEVEYNGTFVILVTGANIFTYTVTGTPATPATGTILAASTHSSNLLIDFAGDSIAVDPSGITAGFTRVDAIVFSPSVEQTVILEVIEGVESDAIAVQPPDKIDANQTIIGFVKLVNGQTDVAADDIITNFDPFTIKTLGNNEIIGDLLSLESSDGEATIAVKSRNTTPANLQLYNDGVLTGRIVRNNIGLHFSNILGGIDKLLSIFDTGQIKYSSGVGLSGELFPLVDSEFGSPGSSSPATVLPLTIETGQRWLIIMIANVQTTASSQQASLDIGIAGAGAAEVDVLPTSQFLVDAHVNPIKSQMLCGIWDIQKPTEGAGNATANIQYTPAIGTPILDSFGAIALKGTI